MYNSRYISIVQSNNYKPTKLACMLFDTHRIKNHRWMRSKMSLMIVNPSSRQFNLSLYSINSSISDNKQWTMLIISMPVHKWNSVYWSHKQYKLKGNCTQTAKTLMCCLMPYIILKVTHALFTKQLLLFFLIVVIFNKCILVSRSEQ